ncbi:MAG: hypothetical protein HYV95_04150 [Opitutae bacterium]|nr:hypothetical protein [Opitutae bacterium]
MRSAPEATSAPSPTDDEQRTGLPGLRSWRSVYWVVLGIFILWVALLTWLTRHFA